MNFSYPGIETVISTDISKVNCLVVENKKLLREIIEDIYNQSIGYNGNAVISENNKILSFTKSVDLSTNYFPFELNRKTLINKVISLLEKYSLIDENYEKTMELTGKIQQYIDEISYDLPFNIEYEKLSISSILKSVGISISDDSDSLAERIINYFELVRELDSEKLFILVNLRTYMEDTYVESFIESVIKQRYNVLMIEGVSYPKLINEKRITIDNDLCEF